MFLVCGMENKQYYIEFANGKHIVDHNISQLHLDALERIYGEIISIQAV